MRRSIFAIIAVLFLASLATAQSSSVSIQVTDNGGVAWANGTVTFSYVGPVNATWPGGNIPVSITASLNSSGAATQSVPDNNTISPGPSQWALRVCPQLGLTAQCVNQAPVKITGASPSLSLTPPAPQIQASNNFPVSAYADAELVNVPLGFQYYNTVNGGSPGLRVCTGISGSTCTSWSNLAASGISGSGTTGFMTQFTGANSIGNSPCDVGITTVNHITCTQVFITPSIQFTCSLCITSSVTGLGFDTGNLRSYIAAIDIFDISSAGPIVRPSTALQFENGSFANDVGLSHDTAANTLDLGSSNTPGDTTGNFALLNIILGGHLNQSATGKFAGKCSMATTTTCSFSIATTYTSAPVCISSPDATTTLSSTAIESKCALSGTTVTVSAGASNSRTWDAVLVGNPN